MLVLQLASVLACFFEACVQRMVARNDVIVINWVKFNKAQPGSEGPAGSWKG